MRRIIEREDGDGKCVELRNGGKMGREKPCNAKKKA